MHGSEVIGKHKWPCGGDVVSWYDSGHYYSDGGIYCQKCNLTFDSYKDHGIELFKPMEPEIDDSYIKMAEGREK